MPTLCYGFHAVLALLDQSPDNIEKVLLAQHRQDKRVQALLASLKQHHVAFKLLPSVELDSLASGVNHQGVIAVCRQSPNYVEADLPRLLTSENHPWRILILDGVQDPHNLGACLRSADAAGVALVIVPKDNAVGLTPVVRKTACGAAETVPLLMVTNLVRAIEQLKKLGCWCYGAAGEAEQSIYDTDLTGNVALVLGAEGKGLRRLTRQHCDGLLKIPMLGTVESLNVSVAAGICLFECLRQQIT